MLTHSHCCRWANDGVIPYMSSFSALPEALVAEVKLKKATLFPAGQMQPEV